MSNTTVSVKVGDLEGVVLDWAVAHATKAWEWAHKWFPTMTLDPTFSGVSDYTSYGCIHLIPNNSFRQGPQPFIPSTDPGQGFPILVEHKVSLMSRHGRTPERDYWFAQVGPEEPENDTLHDHKDPLVAGLRAVVHYHLGSVVDIPEELIGDVDE